MILCFLDAFRMLAMLACPTAFGFNVYTIVMHLLSLFVPVLMEFIFIHNDMFDFVLVILACPVPDGFGHKIRGHKRRTRG